jgi:hypothetical protein
MKEATEIVVATFSQRPDLLDKVFGPEIQSAVPEFVRHDPAGALYYGDGRLDQYREFGLVAVDLAEPDRPVARAFSVPFAFRDGSRGREVLPDGGWDAVIRWARRGPAGRTPDYGGQRPRDHGGAAVATARHLAADACRIARQREASRLS